MNWFFAEAGKQPGVGADMPEDRSVRRMTTGTHAAPTIPALPTIAGRELGETPWEQRLIRELRTRHYQWRTEQTYRMWATRFARWLQQRHRTPEEATEEQIRDFLADLATRQHCSASTQRQALNALVFFLREALAKPSADFGDFTRARESI